MMKTNKTKNILSVMLLIAVLILASACSAVAPTATQGAQPESSIGGSVAATPTLSYEERTLIRIATLKGPTGMGMVKLFDDNDNKLTTNRYETLIVGTPDEIVGKISSGELDIAAVPTNLASTLYNKTSGNVQLLAINTLGVLYILEKGDTVRTVADLKGKKLYASGKGATPEFVLNYILTQNGIDPQTDLTVEYKTEHSELLALAASGTADLVLLPEPFVTTLLTQDKGFTKKLDFTQEWASATTAAGVQDSVLAMGGIIVRKDFAADNKAAVDAFLAEYEASVRYVNDNLDAAAELIVKYSIMAAAGPARSAIPSCNIVYIDGADMKTQIAEFFKVLLATEPKSIGGKLPGDDFYYSK
ncbi:MAG: ABC transporter substrate-binding protein [Saccharofermentanales bacterium]